MILHSKVLSGEGGGGRHNTSNILLKERERLYNANLALYVDYEKGVLIHKNRWSGITGKVTTKELVNIVCRILAEHIFDGRMKLFQAGMEKRLKWAVNRIIKE